MIEEFSLERYIKLLRDREDYTLITRGGKQAEILCFNSVYITVKIDGIDNTVIYPFPGGRYIKGKLSDLDLMIQIKIKK